MSEESVNSNKTIEPTPPPATTKPVSAFSIWPPTNRTRDAVRTRLVETLVDPFVLSKRYVAVSRGEAVRLSETIEEEAFHVADGDRLLAEGDDDGIDTLKVYTKEISVKMLDVLKARSAGTGADEVPPAHVEEEDDVGSTVE